MEQPEKVIVKTKELQDVMDYLTSRPFREVNHLIKNMMEVIEQIPEQENNKETNSYEESR